MDEWKEYAIAAKEAGKTYFTIGLELDELFGIKKSVDQLRTVCCPRISAKKIETPNPEVVGIIPDMHYPFAHPNHLEFLTDTFEEHGVTRIVCIGDLVDFHAVSRFQTETDAISATGEFELARKCVDEITRAFPSVEYVFGNHCTIIERQAATLGIPKFFLKEYKALLGLPDGWNVSDRIIINDVLYEHGIGCTGVNGAINKAVTSMQSCAIGHSHAFGGCQYRSNSKHLIFGLQVGCLVDIEAYAFRYGKHSKNRETLGAGIVKSSTEAYFVPLGKKYLRSAK